MPSGLSVFYDNVEDMVKLSIVGLFERLFFHFGTVFVFWQKLFSHTDTQSLKTTEDKLLVKISH